MKLIDALRNEPASLDLYYGDNAVHVVRSALAEIDGLPNTRKATTYMGTAALLDPAERDDYGWISQEVEMIDADPDFYDNYIPFLYHMPLTVLMVTLGWLQHGYPTRYEHLMAEINSGANPQIVQIHQRIQRTMQHLTLSDVVDPETLNALKEAMA